MAHNHEVSGSNPLPATTFLVTVARLANVNRSQKVALYVARSNAIKDAAMFGNLKALIAEAKTEAASFFESNAGVVKEFETDVSDLISMFKTARTQGLAALKMAEDDLPGVEKIAGDVAEAFSAVIAKSATAPTTVLTLVGDVAPVIGSLVTGIAALDLGTKVAAFDPNTNEITLSKGTASDIDANQSVTITPPSA